MALLAPRFLLLALVAIVSLISTLPTTTHGQDIEPRAFWDNSFDIASLLPSDLLDGVPSVCNDGSSDAEFPAALSCVVRNLLQCSGLLLGGMDTFEDLVPAAESIQGCGDIREPFCNLAEACEPCIEEFDDVLRCIVGNSEAIDAGVTALVDSCALTCDGDVSDVNGGSSSSSTSNGNDNNGNGNSTDEDSGKGKGNGNGPPPLRFRRVVNNQGKSVLRFKVLQLADLHYGEDSWWGPQQDRLSTIAIKSYLQDERPDLVVLSGDQLTAKNIDDDARSYHGQILDAMLKADPDTKWATIFGNHDDETYSQNYNNGTVVQHPAKTSRVDLATFDASYPGSYTLQGSAPDSVSGTSNYVLSIRGDGDGDDNYGTTNKNTNEEDKVLLNMYLFDSGGGHIASMNHQNQVEWFQSQQTKMSNSNSNSTSNTNTNSNTNTSLNLNLNTNTPIPAVAFQHIATSAASFAHRGDVLCGGHFGEGVSPVASDSGLFEALEEDGNVHFLSVGHDHGNDYCCPANGDTNSVLSLCFGRHSGHGGYTTYRDGLRWKKGARTYVFEYDEDDFTWSSYVRVENGDVEDRYRP